LQLLEFQLKKTLLHLRNYKFQEVLLDELYFQMDFLVVDLLEVYYQLVLGEYFHNLN
jgi:hypothetical protein